MAAQPRFRSVPVVDVVLVRWPMESDRRQELAAAGVPRLLLLENDVEPPLADDCLEDWVWVPASERAVAARVAGLSVRQRQHNGSIPELDADGVLRMGDAWVSLPPVEARLCHALLGRFGAVVGREALTRAGWVDAPPPGRNVLDVHVLRLRRRLHPVGLAIRTIRSRGYLLEAAGPTDLAARA